MTVTPTTNTQGNVMRVVAAVFIALSFFILGNLVIENDVNYPAWRTLSTEDLIRHHAAIEAGLGWTMFPAMALHLALGVVLMAKPWPPLGRRAALFIVASFSAILLLSFALIVPLHIEVGTTGAQATVEQIISRHRLFRWPIELLAAAASLYALLRVLR